MLVLRFLASFSCVMHVVRCKQKEESFFFVTPKRVCLDEYLTNWSPWQIDPSFSREIDRWGRGGVRGPNQERNFLGGGHIGEFGRGGGDAGPKKKSSDLRSPEVGISAIDHNPH